MAITCFTDFYTLRGGCSQVAPKSGRFFNDLPGVSLFRLEDITTSGDGRETIDDLYARIYENALRNLERDADRLLPDHFRRTSVIESLVTHELPAVKVPTVAGAEYRGVYIEFNGSSLLEVEIPQVRFFSNGVALATIRVWDAFNGQILATETLSTFTQGWNVIEFDDVYTLVGNTKRLFIGYDATFLTSVETELNNDYGNCDCLHEDYEPTEFVEIKGASIATGISVIEGNLTKENSSHGLIVTVNLKCGVANLICQNKRSFEQAFEMRLLIDFWMEVLNTDRINAFTVDNGRDRVNKMLYGEEGGNPGLIAQYEAELDSVGDRIQFNDPICFHCDEAVERVNLLP